ncbi:OsmC family peroxiredoxin [Mycetocola tolaasinivorans]|uniref:OsmC family peroxiredoxin n=1 Tax=Mycetocola tolaasinivorans TaxID=76635 RepID=A0A3L7A394_9MICO|nr:OsmC family protein [Mycetocola tolaasinivorans]RLP74813.1 OsmC family peroxiredoxin [Mycetocola tolaasinivorans]
MIGEHSYRAHLTWTGNRGTGTSDYRAYDRDITVNIEGKPEVLGSSDRPFRGNPERWNPEDHLLTALAECHLLSYLHVAVTVGVVVTAYTDDARGTMHEDGRGGGAFTEVVLRPIVTVADAEMVDAAYAAHARANQLCFIANSVNFPVRHEPVIRVAGAI